MKITIDDILAGPIHPRDLINTTDEIEYIAGVIQDEYLTESDRDLIADFLQDAGNYTRRRHWKKWLPLLRKQTELNGGNWGIYFIIAQLMYCTIDTTEPSYPWMTSPTLNIRAITDEALKLKDRIIFSVLWSKAHWGFINKRKWVRPSLGSLSIRTGYNNNTIAKSIKRLIDGGYLSDDTLYPSHKHQNVNVRQYFRVSLGISDSDGDIIRAIMSSGPKKSVAWWCKVLGISRRSYFRYTI